MKFSLPPDTPKGQRRAINADEKIITVGAGAGTGKTWVLSGRYVRLLLESEDVKPSDILTLTYTEAAAGDMKLRIEERTRKELENAEDEDLKRKILDGLADNWISTIHSFAARLIHESGLSLDIDPAASVISKRQEEDFWENIRNAAEFANLKELARAYGNKILQDAAKKVDEDDFFAAAVSKWRAGSLSGLARFAAELHASSGQTWENMLAWSEDDKLINETKPLVKNILLDEWGEVWRIWENIILPPAKKQDSPGGRLNEILDWQARHNPDAEALQNFYTQIMTRKDIFSRGKAVEPFITLQNFLGSSLGEWRKTRPKNILEITKTFSEDFSPEELHMRKLLMKFCAVSWGMWDMMKRRRGLLSFSDMILHARDAITKGGINRKFLHILVDEFQDTDPLQFQMIEALAGENTKLFAVGDPKQSIYKFRHADPSLFADTINKANERVELDVSFRTRKNLLERVNKIFASLWRGGLGRSEAMQGLKFEPLNAGVNTDARNSGTMPDFKIILARHNKSNTEDAKKILANNIARKIFYWVQNSFTVWDKKENIIRPVKFSDFAILSRSRNIYPVLEEALEKFGIKSVQDRSTDFFGRGEINDVVCTLRAAANFDDDFAVTGWLMSPFSGVKESEAIEKVLLKIDEQNKPIDLIKKNFPETFSRLEYFALVGEIEGPAGLLAIFDKNRAWLSCYRENDRVRVLRNLRHALAIAREFERSGTSGLIACAEWLTRAVRNEVSYEEPAWHDENENAVRLGVVHSAKGLEYPVTVIFESRTKKNYDLSSLRPSKNLGVVFSSLPDEVTQGQEIKPRCFNWEKLLAEQGDIEEEERLFYVAATRAQDSLIFCGLVDEVGEPHNNTWTKFLLENVDDAEPEFAEDFNSQVFSVKNDEAKILKPVEIVSVKNSLRQISASSFSLFEWCPFAWRRNYRQGINLSWELPENFSQDDDDDTGGADLGSLAHWVLARWPQNENYLRDLDYWLNDREIISKLPAFLRDVWRDKNNKRVLKEWLINFAASELGEKLRRGGNNISREHKFRVKLTEKISMAGAIDALDGNNIFDYKITKINNAPPGLYESQLEFYALAVHEMTHADSVKTCIIFLRENEFVERVCENFSGIRERVIRAAEICASGPYNANVKNCALCPFKKGCVMNAE